MGMHVHRVDDRRFISSDETQLMHCTVAAIIAFLGFMPPKGTVISIPRSAVNQISVMGQLKAKLCARRHGIKWQIDESK